VYLVPYTVDSISVSVSGPSTQEVRSSLTCLYGSSYDRWTAAGS